MASSLSFDIDANSKLRKRNLAYEKLPASKDGELVYQETGKGRPLAWCLFVFLLLAIVGSYVWLGVEHGRITKISDHHKDKHHSHHHHHDDDDDDGLNHTSVAKVHAAKSSATVESPKVFPKKSIDFGSVFVHVPFTLGTAPINGTGPFAGTVDDELPGEPADETGAKTIKSDVDPIGIVQFAEFSADAILPSTYFLGYRNSIRQSRRVPNVVNIGGPTEPSLGVGPNHIVVAGNAGIHVRDKTTGTLLAFANVIDFFYPVIGQAADNGNDLGSFDPRIEYDANAGRFVILYAAYDVTGPNRGRVALGVSSSSDPFDPWYLYVESIVSPKDFLDFPKLAIGKRYITITAYRYNFISATTAGDIVVIDKTLAYAGQPIPTAVYFDQVPAILSPAIDPAGTTDDVYLTEELFGFKSINSKNTVRQIVDAYVFRHATQSLYLQGRLYSPEQANIRIAEVPQLGTTNRLEPFIGLASEPMYANGVVHFASGLGTLRAKKGFFYYVQYVAEDVTNASTTHFVHIESAADSQASYIFPAVAVTNANDVVITFSVSSPTMYPSSAYITHRAGDAVTLWSNAVMYAQGTAPYIGRADQSVSRWGDFLDCARDSDVLSDRIWCIGMYSDGVTAKNPTNNVTFGLAPSIIAAIDFS